LLVLSTSSPLDVAASQAAAPQAAPGNAAVPPKVEVAPSIVSKPAPEYTDEGRAARIQGSVLVGAEIDEQGQVENVRLIRGLGFGLDKKALESVKQWQFKPGTRGGVAAKFYVPCHVDFRLPEGGPWQIDGNILVAKSPADSRAAKTPPELTQYASPSAEACTNKGGYVALRLDVDERGSVSNFSVIMFSDERLAQAAIAAARSWKFKPAELDHNAAPGESRVVLACDGPEFALRAPESISRVGSGTLAGGISRPQLIFNVEPQFSEEARKAKHQGATMLRIVIDQRGRPIEFVTVRPLGFGLDEKAFEAVAQWRFIPGMKGDLPVKVSAMIEVNFKLL